MVTINQIRDLKANRNVQKKGASGADKGEWGFTGRTESEHPESSAVGAPTPCGMAEPLWATLSLREREGGAKSSTCRYRGLMLSKLGKIYRHTGKNKQY